MELPGIGPKTTSWITRDWLDSDEVAIIDVHIHRAGLIAGIFNAKQNIHKHYFDMENIFLDFSESLGVRASVLDNLIWRFMKDIRIERNRGRTQLNLFAH